MKIVTVLNKRTNSLSEKPDFQSENNSSINNERANMPALRRDFRYLYWLFIAVLVISVFSLLTTAYSSSPVFKLYLDSINNSDIIYFDFGKYELKSNVHPVIDKIINEMDNNKNYHLEIKGYTDDIGSDLFNNELSIKRAEEVRNYILSKGIDSSRIIITGKGEEEPLNDNSTYQNRALNRRVEFSLIENKSITEKVNIPEDNEFVNSNFIITSRNEINTDISIRDTAGIPIENIKEEDINAVLRWETDNKPDSTSGYPRLIPIDDKKKIAFTLTMDYSGSMYGTENDDKKIPKSDKIIAMEKSVKLFIDQLGNNMFCKIIKFGEKVLSPIRFTKSKELLYGILEKNSYPMGGTALYSSIYTALSDTTYQSNPTVMKTVIAFTDGMENSSGRITIDSIYKKSNLTNTKVFTVGLFNDVGNYQPREDELIRRRADMLKIAQNTGGFFYLANDNNKLTEIYTNIMNQVLKSYNVSIVWDSDKLPPKGTEVKVELKIKVNSKIRVLYKNYIME